jgi:glycerophosphoryl diester phosphodiesterase
MLADFGRVDDVIVASFHDAALAAFRAVAPDVPTSFALQEAFDAVMAIRSGRPVGRVPGQVALQLPHRFGDEVVVDAALVAGAHAQGIAVHVWTVDDPSDMAQLVEIGVDGIMTDVPSVLSRVLRQSG